MKKRNFKLLRLKKHKISKLNMLNKFGGIDTETETTGTGTTLYPTANCDGTEETCESIDPLNCGTVDTTKSLGDNTFNNTCDCGGIATGVGC